MKNIKIVKKYPIIILICLLASVNLIADFKFAKELYNDDLYDEAIKEFQKVISDYPTSSEAEESLYYIGKSNGAQNKLEAAEANFNQIWQGYPNSKSKDRTLYLLAVTQKDLKKYRSSYNNFIRLLDRFALSNYSQQALKFVMEVLFLKGDYDECINQGKKFLDEYKGNKQIPDVLLYMAKAEIELANMGEVEEISETLRNQYPNSNAFWDMNLINLELKARMEAIEGIENYLEKDIPRFYEEKYRAKLSDYYLEEGHYQESLTNLEILMSKFNNSSSMDKYLTQHIQCQVKLGKIDAIYSNAVLPRELTKSDYREQYIFHLAESEYLRKDFQQMSVTLDKISNFSNDAFMKYQVNLLSAKALKMQGRLIDAIALYKELLQYKWAINDLIDLVIADIYYVDLQYYSQAITYFDKTIFGYRDPEIISEAQFKKALCYEEMKQFSMAVDQLNMIDLVNTNDAEFINQVKKKKAYLQTFKVVNYESAFTNLLKSIYNYSKTNDNNALKMDVVNVLSKDIKDYETSLAMITPISQDEFYLKSKLLLKQAEKKNAESDYQTRDKLIIQLDEMITNLDSSVHPERILELNLRRDIILTDPINELIERKLISYLENYPSSNGKNKFVLTLIEYYRDNGRKEDAIPYQENLELGNDVDSAVFYEEKIDLAEYYYSNDEDLKAKDNYEIARETISLNKPEILFHYAVVLDQLDFKEKADEKLEFLVNNSNNYSGYVNAINYYTDFLIDQDQYQKAVNYYTRIPLENRDNDYYEKLSLIYRGIGQKEEAKLALMHISDKSLTILEDLAELQFETGDLAMAEYTYQQLIDKDPKNLDHYYKQGHIAFLMEKYIDAATRYKIVVDQLGDAYISYENIKILAVENIISLYRIENRPKAELLLDKFESLISDQDKQRIKINEGIYYLKIDSKKSIKIFSKIIKEPATADFKYTSQFWRGVCYLSIKKETEAEADFLVVMESNDRDMINRAALKLGTLKFTQQDFDKALQYYYEVITNDESGKYALDAANNFAYVCKSQEQWQKAVAAYEIILEKWGDSELEGKTLFDIAYCHYRDHKYGESIKMFNKSIPLLNDRELQAEAQFWKGEAYYNMEDYSDAVTEFLKVGYNYQEFTHWAASAELRAADAYDSKDDIVKAKRLYQRVIDKYGELSQWGKLASSKLAQY